MKLLQKCLLFSSFRQWYLCWFPNSSCSSFTTIVTSLSVETLFCLHDMCPRLHLFLLYRLSCISLSDKWKRFICAYSFKTRWNPVVWPCVGLTYPTQLQKLFWQLESIQDKAYLADRHQRTYFEWSTFTKISSCTFVRPSQNYLHRCLVQLSLIKYH